MLLDQLGPDVVQFVQTNPKLTVFLTSALFIWRLVLCVERALPRIKDFYSVLLKTLLAMAEETVHFLINLRGLLRRFRKQPKSDARLIKVISDKGKGVA